MSESPKVPEKELEIEVRGGPRGEGANSGKPLHLTIPDRPIKEERKVVIWAGSFEDESEKCIFKAYLHGRIRIPPIWDFCAEREYEALRRLDEGGVSCTRPVLWGVGQSAEHGRHEVLVTREIEGAASIRDAYRKGESFIAPDILAAIGREVRRMHRLGIYHCALSWKNVLVSWDRDGRPKPHLIDLARSLRFDRDIAGSRMAWFDLLHFCHHLVDSLGAGLPKEVCLPFLEEYGLDGPSTARLFAALDRYRPERKNPRRIRRIEFLLRLFLSRLRPR